MPLLAAPALPPFAVPLPPPPLPPPLAAVRGATTASPTTGCLPGGPPLSACCLPPAPLTACGNCARSPPRAALGCTFCASQKVAKPVRTAAQSSSCSVAKPSGSTPSICSSCNVTLTSGRSAHPCSRIGGRVVGRSGRRGGGSGGDGSLVEEEAHRHREHLLHILPHHRRRLGVLTPLRTAAAAATTGARATATTATAAAAAAAAPRPRANPGRSLNRVARERRKEAGYSALQNPPLDAPSEVRLPLSDFDRLAAPRWRTSVESTDATDAPPIFGTDASRDGSGSAVAAETRAKAASAPSSALGSRSSAAWPIVRCSTCHPFGRCINVWRCSTSISCSSKGTRSVLPLPPLLPPPLLPPAAPPPPPPPLLTSAAAAGAARWRLLSAASRPSSHRCHPACCRMASQLARAASASCVRWRSARLCVPPAELGSSRSRVPSSGGCCTRSAGSRSGSCSGAALIACATRDHRPAGGGSAAPPAASSKPSSRSAARRSTSDSPCIRSASVSKTVPSSRCCCSIRRATSAVPTSPSCLGGGAPLRTEAAASSRDGSLGHVRVAAAAQRGDEARDVGRAEQRGGEQLYQLQHARAQPAEPVGVGPLAHDLAADRVAQRLAAVGGRGGRVPVEVLQNVEERLDREERLARGALGQEGAWLALDELMEDLVHLELHLDPREEPQPRLAEEQRHLHHAWHRAWFRAWHCTWHSVWLCAWYST
eukprot:scaffold9290_cov63-Phaeocystis_antarctica.AAC.10